MADLRTLVVDDEPLARLRILTLLRDERDVDVVGECANGSEAVAAIEEHSPDLVFLDVQMPEVDGFEVLEAVGAERMPATIFVTAYDRYALRAFDVQAIDYLLKPFSRARFQQALGRARARIAAGAAHGEAAQRLLALLGQLRGGGFLERIAVSTDGRVSFVRVEEVEWVESAGNYLRLHTASGIHLLRGTMKSIEQRLDPVRFVRVNRSAMVNVDRIVQVEPWFRGEYVVILRGGARVHSGWGFGSNLRSLMSNPL